MRSHKAARRPQREKAMPVRVAAIRQKMQLAAQLDKPTLGDMLTVDASQMKVPAVRTMGVPDERDRDSPSVKAGGAVPAAPGTQTR